MNLTLTAIASILALSVGAVSPTLALASDTEKLAEADRYLRAVPMKDQIEDVYAQLAMQLPSDERAQFIADMRAIVSIDLIERIAKDAMLRIFTAQELKALADFYSSEHGASVMAKYGAYMGEVMPRLEQEVFRAVLELEVGSER